MNLRAHAFNAQPRFNFQNRPFLFTNNDISFVLSKNNKPSNIIKSKQNIQTLFLLDTSYQYEIYQYLPKTFTITTRDGSSNFNYEMLIKASRTIANEAKMNPEISEYHLDISDEGNVLEKFSQLFQGKYVKFSEDDLPVSYKFIRTLKITNCPDFLKPYNLRTGSDLAPENYRFKFTKKKEKKDEENETEKEVVIDQNNFNCFISKISNKNFTIITNKKTYICKLYAVFASHVILDFLKANPTADRYEYKSEDEYDEFEDICKLFNFQRISITKDNMYSLKKIIEELKITSVEETINNFIENYDKLSEQFDNQEDEMNEMDDLFCELYSINDDETKLDQLKNEIINNNKYENPNEVSELASYIIEVIKTDQTQQNSLLSLILSIEKEINEQSALKQLVPLIIKHTLFLLGLNKSICSFAFKLYQMNIIQKDELFEGIQSYYNIDRFETMNIFLYNSNFMNCIPFWFLPELKEIKEKNKEKQNSSNSSPNKKNFVFVHKEKKTFYDAFLNNSLYNKSKANTYIRSFLPDKLDVFKKIREYGKPTDELTNALKNDDVDKLQFILSQRPIKKGETFDVPYNIFDDFMPDRGINYIDYSAASGSLKCFKYLLLNHFNINELTLKYAIIGGNIEIIKIIDQQLTDKKDFLNLIVPTIAKHQNDLFDWLFNQKFASNIDNADISLLNSLVECSVANGNAHSLIEIIDKGYDLTPKFDYLINIASSNGFYKIAKIICEIVPKKDQNLTFHVLKGNSHLVKIKYIPCISFGNTNILDLYIDYLGGVDIPSIYIFAAVNEYINVIKYIENLPEEKFKLVDTTILKALELCIKHKNDFLSNYLIAKFYENLDISDTSFNRDFFLNKIFEEACNYQKNELAKKIIEMEYFLFPAKDFSSAFITSVSLNLTDVCQFIIEKKVKIDYDFILPQFNKISSVDEKTFSVFINNIPSVLKQIFIDDNLIIAIQNQNIHLIEYLFKQKVESNNSLIEAVRTNNVEVVDTVLKYIDKNIINNKTFEGSALCIACRNSNLEIVSRLLSIENIDLNLFGRDNITALNIAINNINIEIINKILDFYGDQLKNEIFQLNKSIELILNLNSFKDSKANDFIFPDKNDQKDQQNEQNNENKALELVPILKRILKVENVNLNSRGGEFTVLSFACQINENEIVEFLLKRKEVNVNLTDPANGNTALIKSIQYKNYDIAKKLIEHENIDINISNYDKKTALVFSVENKNIEITTLLLNHHNFNATKSNLDYSFYISQGEITKQLLSIKSLNVNYINNENNKYSDLLFSTKLIELIVSYEDQKEYSNEIIDLIIHHPSFDKEKSLAKFALFKSTNIRDNIEIIKKLLTLFDNDINILNDDGKTLLTSSVINNNQEFIRYILNDPKFDCNKNEILYAFVLSESYPPIRGMLYDYIKEHSESIDFNRRLPNGDDPPKIEL